jgi:hypothetical protein
LEFRLTLWKTRGLVESWPAPFERNGRGALPAGRCQTGGEGVRAEAEASAWNSGMAGRTAAAAIGSPSS